MPPIQDFVLYFSLFVSLFFEIFLLVTYFEVREEIEFEKEHGGKNVSHFPTVTIIVPCFNEEATVEKSVLSLLSLNYPKDRLILFLIDDGSTDNTLKVFQKFKYPHIKIFSKENGGKHTALNFALDKVETELVGCLDADSFVDKNALKRIVPYFEDPTIMAVTPSVKVHEPKTVLEHVQKIEYSWGIFLRRMLSSIGALYVTPGPFSIFRKEVFEKLGQYKQAHHTEDMEIAMRMQKNHYKIVNSTYAHVYTVAPKTIKPLYKQRLRWTYGFLNNAIDYREMFFNKKYGNIGIFILPIAMISIFLTLYTTLLFIWNGVGKIIDVFIKYQTVGFNWKLTTPSFDWFFLNTGTISLLMVIILILTLVILFLSIQIADKQARFQKGIFYYLSLYIFIVPLWLTGAIYNTVFGRKISWK